MAMWRSWRSKLNQSAETAGSSMRTNLKSMLGKLRPRRAPKQTPVEKIVEDAPREVRQDNAEETRELWGRPFPLAERGLDVPPVIKFVEELIRRYHALAKESEDAKRARNFSKQVVEQAHQEAEKLKDEAQRVADLEGSRIVAGAKQAATDLMAEATKKAQNLTDSQVRDAINASRKKADIIEDQAKRTAHRFFIQVHEDMQNQVSSQAQEGYYRLLNNLQDLLSEAQKLESDWKSKTARLWDVEFPDLDQYRSGFLESLVDELKPDTLRPSEGEPSESVDLTPMKDSGEGTNPSPPASTSLQSTPEKVGGPKRTTVARGRSAPAEEQAGEKPDEPPDEPEGRPQNEIEEERPTSTTTDDFLLSLGDIPIEEAAGDVETNPVKEMPENQAGIGLERLLEPTNGSTSGNDVPALIDEEETIYPAQNVVVSEPVSDEPETASADTGPIEIEPEEPVDSAKFASISGGIDSQGLYNGEVELLVPPPVDLSKVSSLYRHLQNMRGLRVLGTSGSWDEGTTVSIALDNPTPLIQLLEKIPAVWPISQQKSKTSGRDQITVRISDQG